MNSPEIPKYTDEHLRTLADLNRLQLLGQDHVLDFNVEDLIESMGITVEPFANLASEYKVEAIPVFADNSIRVDEEAYNCVEEWFGRLRFTLMHELAHFILHKDHLAERNFKTIAEWARFVRTVETERSVIEEQANEFAGRFLVPVDRLRLMIPEERDKLLEIHGTISQFDLIRYTAVRLGKKFNVSPTAIKVRIRKEKLQKLFWKNTSHLSE